MAVIAFIFGVIMAGICLYLKEKRETGKKPILSPRDYRMDRMDLMDEIMLKITFDTTAICRRKIRSDLIYIYLLSIWGSREEKIRYDSE